MVSTHVVGLDGPLLQLSDNTAQEDGRNACDASVCLHAGPVAPRGRHRQGVRIDNGSVHEVGVRPRAAEQGGRMIDLRPYLLLG